ncbi:MAG TPA: hypothetical protein VMF52_14425 [Steroidobacteraceae bacterium]|nr:hypothetical protein [Steroidobacteraceae bacterium]
MGSKFLFILGIVAAHSAIASFLVNEEMPHQRTLVSSCSNSPDTALPDFTPRQEVYAANFMRVASVTEAWQP